MHCTMQPMASHPHTANFQALCISMGAALHCQRVMMVTLTAVMVQSTGYKPGHLTTLSTKWVPLPAASFLFHQM